MNGIDIVLAIILIIALFQGFKRGFILELASLAGIVAGVFGAIHFSHFAALYLSRFFDWNEQTVNLASFAVTFIIILCLVHFLAKFLTKMVDFAMLGIVNKLLGSFFGVLKTAFILSVVLLFASNLDKNVLFLDEETKENSVLYKPVSSIAPFILPTLLKKINEIIDPEDEI